MSHAGSSDLDNKSLAATIKALAPRWFVMRHAKRPREIALLQSRTTLCWLKGPMARADLRRLRKGWGIDARLFAGSLVELDGVAVGIVDEDLFTSRTDFDLVPKARSCLYERSDGVFDVLDV
jgi:hypothetical protein